MLNYYPKHKLFVWEAAPHTSLQKIGFIRHPKGKKFYTASPFIAYQLYHKVTPEAKKALLPVYLNMLASSAKTPVLPHDNGAYPFQQAGVEHIVHQFRKGVRSHLLSDDLGLGKTCQSLLVANEIGAKRIAVVCPASLRLNWVREMKTWFIGFPGQPILTGKDKPHLKMSPVVSYDLVSAIMNEKFDFIIIDECFPAGTKIHTEFGVKNIEDVVFNHKYNFVLTLDEKTGTLIKCKILRRIVKIRQHKLVRVNHEKGSFICTENHEIWTEKTKWCKAVRLSQGDLLRVVREDISSVRQGCFFFRYTTFLFKKLLCYLANDSTGNKSKIIQPRSWQKDICSFEKSQSKKSGSCEKQFQTNEVKQPHGQQRDEGKSKTHIEKNRPQTICARWQWPWFDKTTKRCIEKIKKVFSRGYSTYGSSKKAISGIKNSISLQDRCCERKIKNSDRNRWVLSRCVKKTRTRQKKGKDFTLSRVESVQIYESRDPINRLVFCFEVESAHSFLANGVLVHNCHALKNLTAQRTKKILSTNKKSMALADRAPTLFLTGTPLPNGRPTELWPVIFKSAPAIIDNLKLYPFMQRFCSFYDDGYKMIVTGARRQTELNIRLRGSGFMTRRLKKDVLTDLPPKRYQMVVFDADAETRKVIEKEKHFDANEIVKYGVPVGTALPELRREMGLAKLPQSMEFIENLLVSIKKLVIFCHHVEVAETLKKSLHKFNPVCIIGSTPAKQRQAAIDSFQTDPSVRVFIGNSAAQEGITLTAAHDVVRVEPSWTPGEDDQRDDRLHRIGQLERVMVYILVVEGSLDALILERQAGKRDDIERILK